MISAPHQPKCADLRELFLLSKAVDVAMEATRETFDALFAGGVLTGNEGVVVLRFDPRGIRKSTAWRSVGKAMMVPDGWYPGTTCPDGHALCSNHLPSKWVAQLGGRTLLPRDAATSPTHRLTYAKHSIAQKQTGRTRRPERLRRVVARISDPRLPTAPRNRPAPAGR